ncbi:hypothetical protein ACH41H_24160 [Streptomyces sp. NPDC020800]|uniref:hypothetical protein n=1 Tax=Streptomyces sp. NPDC020800 TaxID=3365092 RepID=UPI0037AAF141
MATPDIRRKAELEREVLHAQADQIGRLLAEALNQEGIEAGGWTHRTDPEYHYIRIELLHPHGLHLVLQHEKSYRKGSDGRMLTVRGVYPFGYCGTRASPINVGIDTTVGHMVRRITRNLLPDYLATLDAALAWQRQDRLDEQNRRTLNRQMEQVLPALHATGHEPDHARAARTSSYWYTSLPTMPGFPRALVSGRVRLSSSGTEAEELRLTGVPQDLLLQILALLNPSQPIEGRIMPRAVGPARRPLSATRIIPGEVIGAAERTAPGEVAALAPAAADGAQPALPGALREAALHRLLIAPALAEQPQCTDVVSPRPRTWEVPPEAS